MARNSAVRAGWSRAAARRCFAFPRSFTGTTAWTSLAGIAETAARQPWLSRSTGGRRCVPPVRDGATLPARPGQGGRPARPGYGDASQPSGTRRQVPPIRGTAMLPVCPGHDDVSRPQARRCVPPVRSTAHTPRGTHGEACATGPLKHCAEPFGFTHGEVRATGPPRGASKAPPGGHAGDPQRDDRQRLDPHRAVLRIAFPQPGLRAVVLVAVVEDVGAAPQHHPCEPGPVFVVPIDDDGDARILRDVAQPLHRADGRTLRFLVDGHVEVAAQQRVADRHHVRDAVRVRRGEPGDAHRFHEPALRTAQHGSRSCNSASDATRTTPSGTGCAGSPGISAKTCMPAATPAAIP